VLCAKLAGAAIFNFPLCINPVQELLAVLENHPPDARAFGDISANSDDLHAHFALKMRSAAFCVPFFLIGL
jgi:hypothetical protein